MKLVEHDTIQKTDETGTGPDATGTVDDGLGRLATERGISENILRSAGIRTQPRDGRYAGWWGIPYPHRTGTWKLRYRNPDPKSKERYRDDQGADFHLYNPLRLGPGEDEIWFAEGEFDTLALIDQGVKAIGIHGVKNVKTKDELEKDTGDEEPEGRFKRSWQLLFQYTLCITIFDNDEDGIPAGRQLARGLDGVAFDAWENGYGDVNDWHRDDPEGLGDAINRFRYGVYRSRGMVPEW